jgi:hypothetical protein
VTDGLVQIKYPYGEEVLEDEAFPDESTDLTTWNQTSYLRHTPTLNIDSQVRLEKTHKKIESDSENDFIEVFQVQSADYLRSWVYTNKFAYI